MGATNVAIAASETFQDWTQREDLEEREGIRRSEDGWRMVVNVCGHLK